MALTVGISGCFGDGLAHARKSEGSSLPPASRLVFGEAPVGTSETAQRWQTTDGADVRGFGSDDGTAGVEFVARAGSTARAEPSTRPKFPRTNRARIVLDAVEASPEAPVQLEVSFFDDTTDNRFWKVVTLDAPGPRAIDLELPLLRYDRGRVPSWSDVTAWGFRFRTAATLRVHSFELWEDGDAASPYLGVDHLRTAFPDPGAVREKHRGAFVVLTDHPDLDVDAVLDALVTMHRRTQRVFPDLPGAQRSVPLLVFATDAAYRDFWQSYAMSVGSAARPLPEDYGYTWQGVATAWYSAEFGTVRPLYIHEASHALMERAMGVDAQRSWLFEGLGNLEQIHVSKQDIAGVYRDALARSDVKMPLRDLIDGRPIPTSRYWQATLLVEWMLDDPGRTAALAGAIADMRRRGSADLRPHLERHFGMDLARFSASFWAWAWTRYAGPDV
jgi:hypothetical protein